jgi:hypothetical protein
LVARPLIVYDRNDGRQTDRTDFYGFRRAGADRDCGYQI